MAKRKPPKDPKRPGTKNSSKAQPRTPASAPKAPSHYDLLGVQPDADADAIRTRYLALVREFPPETHPAQFQAIRSAYDVLIDPDARHQYDRECFYGASLTDLRSRARDLAARGHTAEAADVLHKVVDIHPSVEDYAELANHYDTEQQIKVAGQMLDRALECAETEAERVGIEMQRAHLGSPFHYTIIRNLLAVAERYPQTGPAIIAIDLFTHYSHVGQIRQGMAYFRSLIPRRKYLTLAEFRIYLDWIAVLNLESLTKELNTVIERAKTAARNAAVGPHRDLVRTEVLDRAQDAHAAMELRVAAIYADLARTIDPADETAKTLRRTVVDMFLLQSQLDRLIQDLRIPTDLLRQILNGLRTKYHIAVGDSLTDSLDGRPSLGRPLAPADTVELVNQMYPRIYRAFPTELLHWQNTVVGQGRSARR